MRLISRVIFVVSLIVSLTAAQSFSPETRVTTFLNKYRVMKFTGLPNTQQMKVLGQYFSPKLNKQFQHAWKAQQKFKVKYPQDKPPLVEGDLFSSLFEGATSFKIAGANINGDKADVEIKFNYNVSKQKDEPHEWTDKYKLIRNKHGWFIDDVEYNGSWDFAPKGLLSNMLNQAMKDSQ